MSTKQKDSQTERANLWLLRREGWGEEGNQGLWGGHVHIVIFFKMDSQLGPTVQTGNSARCYVEAWMGGQFGGEWAHIYVWLSLFAVLLKQLRHW